MSGSDSKRWNWLEEGLVPLVSALMYAAWLRPLFQAILSWRLVQPADLRYPAWLIVCIPIAVAAIEQALQERPRARLWTVGAGLAIMLSALVYLSPAGASFWRQPLATLGEVILNLGRFRGHIPAPLLMLMMTAVLILRGLLVDWMAHDGLWRSFFLGVVVLGGLMLLPANVNGPLALGNALAAFLIWGLLSLALLAVATILYTQRALGKKAPTLSRYWLLVVCLAVGIVILAGWGLGLFFSPETVAAIAAWLRPIRQALAQAFNWLLTAIVYVLFLILEPLINWLRNLIAKREMPKIELSKPFADQLKELEEQAPKQTAPVPWGMIAAILIVVAIIIAFILAWRHRERARQGAGVDEQREYIGSLDLFLRQLRDLFNSRRRPRLNLFLDALRADDPRHQIRLLYRRLLTAGRVAEQPRLPGQTPASYARRLARLHPAQDDDLRTLTDAYHKARYADEAPPHALASQAEQATARIEAALK